MRNALRLSLLIIAVLFFPSCQTTRQVTSDSLQGDDLAYSSSHIDFAKWKRDESCCTAQGKSFAVASAGEYSAQTALDVYERGCNVVDAAIAAEFVLAVERPQSTGIGGGGFLTLHLADRKKADVFVDFRETAPHRANPQMFLKDGQVVPNLSRDGVHSAGTPGFVAGMEEVYRRYGSKKQGCLWPDLLAPAISRAKTGFPVYPTLAERIIARQDVLKADPEAAALLLPHGKPLAVGENFAQPELASTLALIAKKGAKAFYRGPIAKKIADYVNKNALPGVPAIDAADLRDYRVKIRKPVVGHFHEYTVVSAPPPSAGGTALIESLNLLSGYDLGAETSRARYYHLLGEVMRRAFGDRQLIADPDFVDSSSFGKLLDPNYAKRLRAQIDLEHATPSEKVLPGQMLKEETPHTAQISLMDDKGNAVSVTSTVNFFFGSARLVSGTGFFLNDEMDDFTTKPGAQNVSGLVGSNVNAVQAGKRPVSSMAPTVVLQGDRPVLVIGAAGSSTIISGVLQTTLNDLVWWKHDLHRALFAARAHHQWQPDKLMIEAGAISPETESKLRAIGHTLGTPPFVTNVQGVDFNPQTATLTAVHDPRDVGGAKAK